MKTYYKIKQTFIKGDNKGKIKYAPLVKQTLIEAINYAELFIDPNNKLIEIEKIMFDEDNLIFELFNILKENYPERYNLFEKS